MRRQAIIIATLGVLLAGCDTTGTGSLSGSQGTGTAVGAALGGAAGYFIGGKSWAGAAVGALAGGFIGNRIGASLDEQEARRLAEASQKAAESPTGQPVQWQSPGQQGQPSGASGWVMPVSDSYQANNGQTCREVRQNATKNGQTAQEDVTLCKGESGWVMPKS